jgi:hypothetical protein
MSDANYTRFAMAVRRLIARPEMRERFEQQETTSAVCNELDITDEMVTPLKEILLALPDGGGDDGPAPAGGSLRPPTPIGPGGPSGGASAFGSAQLQSRAMETVSTAEKFIEQSFGRLSRAATLMMSMSVTMFVIGVAFLAIAGVRSFTHPESVTTTAVVGGIGIIQIVALFYRNPLRDIARAVSNAQQSKMVIMSYMLGVSLVGRSLDGRASDAELEALSKLTQRALEQLEKFTEYPTTGKSGKQGGGDGPNDT